MIHVGTSGWQYDSWKGPFYPTKLPKREWLSHYASLFPVVEVNNTFYHLPREATFDRWREEPPPEFLFVVKASRYITHVRRMRDARDPVELLWSRALRLGDKLGPVLFQFPPGLKADADLLREFLSVLPPRMRAAFEFRHDSWWRDDVCEALDGVGAAWVLADRPGRRAPVIATGGWAYLRFHQARRPARSTRGRSCGSGPAASPPSTPATRSCSSTTTRSLPPPPTPPRSRSCSPNAAARSPVASSPTQTRLELEHHAVCEQNRGMREGSG